MATAEAVRISRPATGTIFLSRRQDLRLVRKARYEVRGAGGEVVDQIRGQAFQFTDNRLNVPESGPMMTDTMQEVDSAEIREWLAKHPLNGDTENGFWELPIVAPPVSDDEMALVLGAALDDDRLVEIIALERAGWARPGLLRAAEGALENLREAMRLGREQAEAEARKPKAKPAAKE